MISSDVLYIRSNKFYSLCTFQRKLPFFAALDEILALTSGDAAFLATAGLPDCFSIGHFDPNGIPIYCYLSILMNLFNHNEYRDVSIMYTNQGKIKIMAGESILATIISRLTYPPCTTVIVAATPNVTQWSERDPVDIMGP